jgi:hypothetical protein
MAKIVISNTEDLVNAYDGFLKSIASSKGSLEKQSDCDPSKRVPLIEVSNKFNPNTILFIGFNPSGADLSYYSTHNGHPYQEVFIYKGKSNYYKAMEEFAKACGFESFSELDALGIVRKKQKDVVDAFLNNPSLYSGMLEIFLNALKGLNPSVVIVANAFVRQLLLACSKKFLYPSSSKVDAITNKLIGLGGIGGPFKGFYSRFVIEPDNANGGYIMKIDNEKELHLYFSCMLSGQRAIDIGNKENLIWLVRNYLTTRLSYAES